MEMRLRSLMACCMAANKVQRWELCALMPPSSIIPVSRAEISGPELIYDHRCLNGPNPSLLRLLLTQLLCFWGVH